MRPNGGVDAAARYFILPPSSFILGFALPPLASNDLFERPRL
jgi:hypothetical protein